MPIVSAASFLTPEAASSARRTVSRSTQSMFCRRFSDGSPAGGLNLVTDPYAALVNVASTGRRDMIRVVPGNPDASYLIHKVEGRSGIAGLRMPFNPPYLTAGQIQVLKRWIEIGAPR